MIGEEEIWHRIKNEGCDWRWNGDGMIRDGMIGDEEDRQRERERGRGIETERIQIEGM